MILKLNEFCKSALKNYDGSHDLFHAHKVACNAYKLSTDEINLSIIAAFLHDTCDPKYVSKDDALNHVKTFLTDYLTTDEIEDVCDAIKHTSFSKLKQKGVPICKTERSYKIWRNVADADMMEALGIIGVFRTLMYQGFKEQNISNAIDYIQNNIMLCEKYISSHMSTAEVKRRTQDTAKFLKEYQKNANVQEIALKIMNEGALKTGFLDTIEKHMKDLRSTEWLWIELSKDLNYALMS
tara:strand:- start:9177 stop:9893 length:717 start_codon:yes stop_codon:yes gene_type:complete